MRTETENIVQVGGCWIEKKWNRRTGKIGRSRLCVYAQPKSSEKLGLTSLAVLLQQINVLFLPLLRKKKSYQVTCGNVNPDMVADVKRGVVDKKNCLSGGITYQHIFRHPNHKWEGKLIKSLQLGVTKEDQFKAQFYPCYKNIIKLLGGCVSISFVRNLISNWGRVLRQSHFSSPVCPKRWPWTACERAPLTCIWLSLGRCYAELFLEWLLSLIFGGLRPAAGPGTPYGR